MMRPMSAGGISRRDFLRVGLSGATAAAGGLWSRAAGAIGDPEKFAFYQLRYPGGQWNPRPNGPQRLLWEIQKRTSVTCRAGITPVSLDAPELWQSPFLFLAGDREVPPWSTHERATLARWLAAGGFLLVDDASGTPGGGFDVSVRREISRVLPGRSLRALPADHVVFKTFYLLSQAVGRAAARPTLEGIERDGREIVIYSANDLAGAWSRDPNGRWEYECVPGGARQREMSFRIGVNLAFYAMCLEYKTDQVHVPFILRRRK